jgi:hypothetical protein
MKRSNPFPPPPPERGADWGRPRVKHISPAEPGALPRGARGPAGPATGGAALADRGEAPRMAGRILRRYSQSLYRATGEMIYFRYLSGLDLELEEVQERPRPSACGGRPVAPLRLGRSDPDRLVTGGATTAEPVIRGAS